MDWIQIIVAIAAGLLLGWFLTRNRNIDYTKIHTINETDFKNNMRKGQLIDIRKKEAYEAGKIKGARHFAVKELTHKYSKVRKDLSIYLYCDNGRKSKRVARKLAKNNFSDIYILEGGFDNLTT